MKKSILFFYLCLSMVAILFSGKANAQVDKKGTEIKRLETALAVAKKNVAKHERSLAIADSLLTKGTEQVNDSKAEIKALETERKALDKKYATEKKALDKLTTSKDKAKATQAMSDIKALDVKYRADAKAMDTRLKVSTKKSTTGSANLTKGKSGKASATNALQNAQASLDVAQEKYDIATGTVTPVEEGKKKRR